MRCRISKQQGPILILLNVNTALKYKRPACGDLPNLEVAPNGKVDTEIFASLVTLQEGKPNSLIDMDGSALVIHDKVDDYTTDPSGNSGDRIVCGVITK